MARRFMGLDALPSVTLDYATDLASFWQGRWAHVCAVCVVMARLRFPGGYR